MNLPNQKKVISVLSGALECKDSELESYLSAQCDGDSEFKNRVLELLEAHRSAGDFLEEPFAFELDSPIPKIGTEVNGYLLKEKIGEGGFGQVFLAEQRDPIQRNVALKFVKSEVAVPEVLLRFDIERQSLAMMNHPSVAQIYDAGSTLDGAPFIAMEFVEGVPLVEYCNDNRLSIRNRLDVIQKVCDAVAHAHKKGIIHRDLKPSNVLVAESDSGAVPKVIDFGVAKALSGSPAKGVTHARQLIGTPHYMSPEQAGFGSDDIDTRSDVYSLGVMLYELLTDKTPLEVQERFTQSGNDSAGSTNVFDAPSKLLASTCAADPSSVSKLFDQPMGSLISEVRGELDWITMKALTQDREKRYQSADDFRDDIQCYLDGKPVTAAPPRAFYRLSKFIVKNRVACLLTALVLGSLATATWVGVSAKKAREQTMREAKIAREHTMREANAVAGLLDHIFQNASPLNNTQDMTAVEFVDRAREAIIPRLNDYPKTKSRLLASLGQAYNGLSHPEKYLETVLLREELGIDEPLSKEFTPLQLSKAIALFGLGSLKEMDAILKTLIPELKAELGEDCVNTVKAEHMKSLFLAETGKKDEALEILERIHNRTDDASNLFIGHDLGLAYHRVGKNEQAINVLKPVVAEADERFGANSIYAIVSRRTLGLAYTETGQANLAIELLEPNLLVSEERHGAEHQATLQNMNALATAYCAAGNFDAATTTANKLIKRRTTKSGPNHRYTFFTRMTLAMITNARGKPRESVKMYEAVAQDAEEALGEGNRVTMIARKKGAKIKRESNQSSE